MRLNFMSKFKNRLASIVLSTITLAGGVTTCLISNSAVYQCQAIITDEEMKKLINKALQVSFQQDPSLPQITANNLKKLLKNTLKELKPAQQPNTGLDLYRWFTLPTLINTFLFQFSMSLLELLTSQATNALPVNCEQILEFTRVLKTTTMGAHLPYNFIKCLGQLIQQEVPSACEYFPDNFFSKWGNACKTWLGSESLQTLLK